MTQIHSFPPISNRESRVLILGSMPGKESLLKNEYYADSTNVFWEIMEEVLKIPAEMSYPKRTEFLLSQRVALWDVIESCTRESSSDSHINESSIVYNDFESFYKSHSHIRKVFFNGEKAERCYERYYKKYICLGLLENLKKTNHIRLPSSSAKNDTKTSDKACAWKAIIG